MTDLKKMEREELETFASNMVRDKRGLEDRIRAAEGRHKTAAETLQVEISAHQSATSRLSDANRDQTELVLEVGTLNKDLAALQERLVTRSTWLGFTSAASLVLLVVTLVLWKAVMQ